MSELRISVSDDIPAGLEMSPDDLPGELRLLAAIKLYELRRLSSGSAALLAGIPRTDFLLKLGEYSVATFRMSSEDVEADKEHA